MNTLLAYFSLLACHNNSFALVKRVSITFSNEFWYAAILRTFKIAILGILTMGNSYYLVISHKVFNT